MALLSGSIRLRRFEARGELPKDFANDFETAVNSHAFAELSENDSREEAVGWVSVADIFDTSLDRTKWLVGDTVNLAIRVDVKRIPSVIFKKECEKLEKTVKERDGRERLSVAERRELKELVKKKLSAKVLPTIKIIEMSWDIKRGEVYLFACSEKVSEIFKTLFEKTFKLKVHPLFPYAIAAKIAGSEERLGGVAASDFAGGK